MAVLAGIDEAGFGPLLGPLVVSSTAFQIEDSLLEADLWQVLKNSVGQTRKHLAGRLLITDSKKAYSKTLGIKHLQRTSLTCLKILGFEPKNLTELLTILSADCAVRIANYPWYKTLDEYKLETNRADIDIASSAFLDDMQSKGLRLLGISSSCLDVGYYNSLVATVKNKSNVLFSITCRLIQNIFDNFACDNLQIIIDRQGGRVHYRKHLLRMFDGLELIIIKETSKMSSYELKEKNRKMRLHFVVGADRKYLPVSLSSMVSKYLRQLMVDNINRYFIAFHPQLEPTAGYWKDGQRFVKDLKTHIPHVTYANEQLIRCR